ncbi:MAG TPA: glycerol-3-phosphate acyltransferase, partial [Desulfocapsa sulfexigens]|nr:glycerol-3-phosphate acyltransferase [Desulfocapsa sulfexigens]
IGFKGGKGVATALGVFLFFSPWSIAIGLTVFVVVVGISGFVSAGSLAASGMIPFFILLFGGSSSTFLCSAVIAILIWIKHSSNIGRLRRGEETGWKKKDSA